MTERKTIADDLSILKESFIRLKNKTGATGSNKSRLKELVLCRYAFMVAASKRNYTLERIGKACDKHHSTVIFARHQHETNTTLQYSRWASFYNQCFDMSKLILEQVEAEYTYGVKTNDNTDGKMDMFNEIKRLTKELSKSNLALEEKRAEALEFKLEYNGAKRKLSLQESYSRAKLKNLFTLSDYAKAIGKTVHHTKKLINVKNIPYVKVGSDSRSPLLILDNTMENTKLETNIPKLK